MGAIYLYDWYSRYAPSHLYEGIICGIEKSIISISIGIWRETLFGQMVTFGHLVTFGHVGVA